MQFEYLAHCKISHECDLQAVTLPSLDPWLHGLMFREERTRRLMHEAACLADASTRGDDKRAEIARLRGEAAERLHRRIRKQMDLERGCHPPSNPIHGAGLGRTARRATARVPQSATQDDVGAGRLAGRGRRARRQWQWLGRRGLEGRWQEGRQEGRGEKGNSMK